MAVRWEVSQIGEANYPHTAFLAALDSPFFAGLTEPYLDAERNNALRVVAEYGEKIGPAPDNMSIADLTETLARWTPPQPQGLGGADPFTTSHLLALLKGAAGNGTPDGGLSD